MGRIEQRLAQMGLQLPEPTEPPPGFKFSFSWVRLAGNRAYLSGHGALTPDGKPAGPFGKVPGEVSMDEAQEGARGAAVSMLGSLRGALGDLDRVTAWLMVYGMVNAEPGYPETTNVANGFSDLILDLYGDAGHHARMAVGMAALPLSYCFLAAAEVEIAA
ncbi:MAG TPA: RidA family protein [Acidimicrobiales bacterium]|nr:RidA family protein [Acidimicrobiales bacterium]